MLVGTHLYDGNGDATRRQQFAMSWLQRLPGVEGLNVQFRSQPCSPGPGIETLASLEQDSFRTAGPGKQRKPLTREIFDTLADVARARGHRYFAYVNSDIIVLPDAIEVIERLGRETYAISRHDIAPGSAPSLDGGELLTSGLDMFVISIDWWKRHRRRFRPYVVGDACWDNVYTAIMMCHSDGVILNRERMILHERHAASRHDSTATARYNGFMAALDARYFSLWCLYWTRLEQIRASGASERDEQALRDEVFVWQPSAVSAVRQTVRSLQARLQFRRLQSQWAASESR